MATANSLIHALKRAAASSSTSLFSKLASTSLFSKLAPTVFRCMCSDQDKDGLMYVSIEIPDLKNTKHHATFYVDQQNTMILKDKSCGIEIRKLFSDSVDFHGLNGEIENEMVSLWLPGLLSRLNGEEKIPNAQVMTHLDEYEGGSYAQVKMPGVDPKDQFKVSVEQNKIKMMIITEQEADGSKGDQISASVMVDLPPNLHRFNGIKGEMKDGVCSLWVPEAVQL
ncbi:unnamed protein product [Rhodiola kirilowii]